MFEGLDFPVELMDLPHPIVTRGEKIKGRKAVVRSDTGEVLNIVSNRYQLVRHVDVFGPIHDAINRLGLPIKSVRQTIGNGGSTAKVIWTLDRSITIAGNDTADLTIIGRNSYDYSKMLGLQLGAFRLICSNGAVIGHILEAFYKRHNPSLKVEAAVNEITGALAQEDKVTREWRRWNEIEYLPSRLSNWLETQSVSKAFKNEVTDYFTTQPDRVKFGWTRVYTGWEAYNSLTWAATHRVNAKKPERALVAQEVLDYLADHFAATELKN